MIAVDGPNDIDDLAHRNPAPTVRKACGQTRVLIVVWDPDTPERRLAARTVVKEAQKFLWWAALEVTLTCTRAIRGERAVGTCQAQASSTQIRGLRGRRFAG